MRLRGCRALLGPASAARSFLGSEFAGGDSCPRVSPRVASCGPSGVPGAWTPARAFHPSEGHLSTICWDFLSGDGPRLDDGGAEISGLIFCSSRHLPRQALMSLSIQVPSPVFFSSRRTHRETNGPVSHFPLGLGFTSPRGLNTLCVFIQQTVPMLSGQASPCIPGIGVNHRLVPAQWQG